jgi:hypothetical protein
MEDKKYKLHAYDYDHGMIFKEEGTEDQFIMFNLTEDTMSTFIKADDIWTKEELEKIGDVNIIEKPYF